MDLSFHSATPEDAADVLQFLAAIHEEKLLTLNRMTRLPSVEREREWLKKFSGKDGFSMLARADGSVIGFMHAEILQPLEMSVNCEFGISILADYRRRGIATKMITAAEDWARERGVLRMELGVYSNNVGGIELYEKLGYREDGRRVQAVRLWNGDRADIIHMFKFLNSVD